MEFLRDLITFMAATVWISFVVLLTVFSIIDKFHRERIRSQIEIDREMLYNQKDFQRFIAQLDAGKIKNTENIK